eukprot:8463571-Alexandrium_andersonii.AAC.1
MCIRDRGLPSSSSSGSPGGSTSRARLCPLTRTTARTSRITWAWAPRRLRPAPPSSDVSRAALKGQQLRGQQLPNA